MFGSPIVLRDTVLLHDAIQAGKDHLRPTYAVTGRHVRDDDGITVFFVIVEEGEQGCGT